MIVPPGRFLKLTILAGRTQNGDGAAPNAHWHIPDINTGIVISTISFLL